MGFISLSSPSLGYIRWAAPFHQVIQWFLLQPALPPPQPSPGVACVHLVKGSSQHQIHRPVLREGNKEARVQATPLRHTSEQPTPPYVDPRPELSGMASPAGKTAREADHIVTSAWPARAKGSSFQKKEGDWMARSQ